MGIPSGLKLVKPLTSSLGHFFVFHIRLWTDYVRLTGPLLSQILFLARYIPCFGFTYFIAFMADVTTLMALHIFCLYVYASKIYNTLIVALISLFRLFRGKKWNSLRKRVDHASYEIDQLFLGTLIFTILLFIFPSVFIFYAVFAGLRLAMLLISFFVSIFICSVLNFPILTLASRLLHRSLTQNGSIYYDIADVTSSPHTLYLDMKVSQISFVSIMAQYIHSVRYYNAPFNLDWYNLPLSLSVGQLI
ncbi:phosphatidylinositol N-acetylglucosaminyltransferase subunit Q-like isoform X2 [Gordionus sp. m RMFG-2023]